MIRTLAEIIANGQPDGIINLALPTMALVFCIEKGGQAVRWIVDVAQGRSHRGTTSDGVAALANAVRALSSRLDDQHETALENNRLLAEAMREQTRTMNQLLLALQNVCRNETPTKDAKCKDT